MTSNKLRDQRSSATRRLTSADMLARFGISPKTLHNWIRDPGVGLPPAIIICGRRYWPEEAIETWEASRTRSSTVEAA